MKYSIAILLLMASISLKSQNKSVENWVQDIVADMIEMNDLDRYSSEELSPDVNVNFILVESVKDIDIKGSTITMLVNHGKGTYCTKLTFNYIEKNGNFHLVFSKPETKITLGKETTWITPWIAKTNICN
ncbi:hypothetical protein [Winogradskyella schleiferi]|uniref:hypothetical protein n=1 Tax=Winogradskyella schleiferi TaxID=2686078 RepID=UPI0015C06731|nr:hypothetical protein [Winogradskyella schleiferi]